MNDALDFIREGEWFSILSLGDHPFAECRIVGSGYTHAELREDFIRLRKKFVYFGRNTFDQRNRYFETPDDAWVAESREHPQNVSKNRLSYGPFDAEPDRYRSHIASW